MTANIENKAIFRCLPCKTTTKANAKNANKNNNNWPDNPKSVKECTLASPKIPLRVRNVAYKTNQNDN